MKFLCTRSIDAKLMKDPLQSLTDLSKRFNERDHVRRYETFIELVQLIDEAHSSNIIQNASI